MWFMNTCCAPHLKMSFKHFRIATIVPVSASMQTHCALVIHKYILYINIYMIMWFWISTKGLTKALISCCMAGVTSIHSSNTGNGIFWVWGIFSPHGTVKGIKNIKVRAKLHNCHLCHCQCATSFSGQWNSVHPGNCDSNANNINFALTGLYL